MEERARGGKFEQLYARVFDDIVRGQFRPGDRIGVKDIAARLKVSPTPLREVLSRLVGRGVVEERRSEGYYLARLDAQDIADFLRLHEHCVLRAVKIGRSKLLALPEATDPWALFAEIALAAGDNALIETRALLDDRLAVVRRLECAVVDDIPAELERLKEGIMLDERHFVHLVRQFHSIRGAAAPLLASRLIRGPRP